MKRDPEAVLLFSVMQRARVLEHQRWNPFALAWLLFFLFFFLLFNSCFLRVKKEQGRFTASPVCMSSMLQNEYCTSYLCFYYNFFCFCFLYGHCHFLCVPLQYSAGRKFRSECRIYRAYVPQWYKIKPHWLVMVWNMLSIYFFQIYFLLVFLKLFFIMLQNLYSVEYGRLFFNLWRCSCSQNAIGVELI